MRPSTLTFAYTEGSGYVEWLGKGARHQFEYVFRIYSQGNSEHRANRISAYAFNLRGGKGSGSYFQDPVDTHSWILVTAVFTLKKAGPYPANTVTILRDGVVRKTTPLSQYHVVPKAGSAPFEVGTVNGKSFFEGGIGKVAVFNRVLTPAQVEQQFNVMMQ